MATWQFDFYLIPSSSVQRRFGGVPLTITIEEFDRVNWWLGSDLFQSMQQDVSSLLPKAPSWSTKTERWGQDEGDRFDVVLEGEQIVEVFVRLDVRSISLPFLSRVVEIARKYDLLLLTEDRHVLRPSMKELMSAIRRSSSFKCVQNPEWFLSEISRINKS